MKLIYNGKRPYKDTILVIREDGETYYVSEIDKEGRGKLLAHFDKNAIKSREHLIEVAHKFSMLLP